MGELWPQDGRVQHLRQPDVIQIDGFSGDLTDGIWPDVGLANIF
jgi:hypothetical protein